MFGIIKKFLRILVLGVFLSSNSYADSKFAKDLAKVSKHNGFIDNKGEIYSIEQITDKKNTILIIFNHGSTNDQAIDKCTKAWDKVPPVILSLHDQKIKNFQIKIYKLCSGVRGWSKSEQDRMFNGHKVSKKSFLKLTNKEGLPLIQTQKQFLKQKVIKEKINNFIDQGFENIVLAGQSAGSWASITLKSKFPEKIDGVIAFNPAFSGKRNNRKQWPYWEAIRSYGISVMNLANLKNTMVYAHNKDGYENLETLSFLSDLSTVTFMDITGLDCKGTMTLGKGHGIALTECFAEHEAKDKNIIKFLEEIF